MESHSEIASKIIKNQEAIIGPIALEQAKKVPGLKVTAPDKVLIEGDEKEVLNNLVTQYAKLFGRASIEVCRDAVNSIQPKIPKDQLPQVLQ
jgi:hypothetical protein